MSFFLNISSNTRMRSHSFLSQLVEPTDSTETALPVKIDAEGIVQNGPFRTCECSGNVFFGEDRVECLQGRSHHAGDVVVFCIWNEMLQIRAIDQVSVRSNQNKTYQLIQNGIPDIHTQTFLRTRAAVVATVLDPVWFSETSAIFGLQVELQGEAMFHMTEEYDLPHLVNARQHPYHGLRQLAETDTARPDSENASRSVIVAAVATVIVLMAVLIFVMGCFASPMVHKQEQRRRSERWEHARRYQQEDLETHLSDHDEPQIVAFGGYLEQFPDDAADLTLTTAQLSDGDERSMGMGSLKVKP